jgi:transcription initiation factor TFIID subunit 3
MSSDDLFRNLLRPAVLHILRASGFHYGKPSAVDTVVDLTARYITLLAERTAYNAYSNHNDSTPNITDARMAMQDCGLLVPTMTAGEEEWKQILRKPLDFYNAETGAREMEEQRRAEDTADVKEFIDWVQGDQNKEIRRIAGTLKDIATNPTEQLDQLEMEDYLNSVLFVSRTWANANVVSSTHEEAQQNWSRITFPRDCSWGPLRAEDGQNRRRRRRVN